jgi:multiple sugar transport system permease protein
MMNLRAPWWLLLPALLATLLLVLVPAAATLWLSMAEYDALSPPRWLGLDHYRQLVDDPMFRLALHNSLWLAAILVPTRVLLAWLLALLLHPRERACGTARAAVLAPALVPDIAWALLWLWLLNPLVGPAAALLQGLGLPAAATLMSADGARLSIAACLLFLVGEMVLVLIAVRREIPETLYALGTAEGASRLTMTRRLTLPLMTPAVLLLACRDLALAFQITLVPALIITKGGPLYATTFLPLYVYQNAFEYLRFGYAAAMSAVMIGLTLAAIGLQLLLLRRWLRT